MKIIFSADLQVKVREDNLFRSSERTLNNIYDVIKETKAECYCVIGDFFEYPKPNDSERKLINNHLGKVLALDTIKEVVLMCGNHDLEKEKKIEEHQRGFNPLSILVDFINTLDDKLASKITYCKSSEQYISKADSSLIWLPYSLEDQEVWRNVDSDERKLIFGTLNPNKNYICLYHDILREYIDQTNLPIQKKRYNELMSINDFPSSIIYAGDIHKNWGCFSFDDETQKISKRFTYTNSPMPHTHSEGSYILINESLKSQDIIVESKNIKYLDTECFKNLDNFDNYSKDISLKDFIVYNTLIIDNNLSEENLLESFHNKIKSIKFGLEQTYIKIKCASTKFMSYEKELYEELQYLISSNNYKRVVINFSYDKFIDVNISETTNETIKELQQEVIEKENNKTNEKITDISKIDNIDSLVLDQTKLYKLFNSVLDDTLKNMKLAFDEDVTEDSVREEINTIFQEELNKALKNNKRFNIRFDYVECNGFMLLGANRIQLDYPGITRISGSNGVGKTTMFTLIRWVLIGKIFEELSDRTTTQNTLLVFNDKNPDLNVIVGKLHLFINGQSVLIERIAERTWKSNTTDEQKLSKNWKNYVSKVSSDVKMTVINNEGESTYNGEQVNKVVKFWFGETISTILFLNYDKIKSLLNSNSDNLKQLVLSYIGVNYLQTLEDALPTIKTKLEVIRPKETKESLRSNIELLSEGIKNDKSELEIHKSKVEPLNNDIQSCEEQIKKFSDELIDLGNIPNIIKEKSISKNKYKENIDSFEKQEPKELIPFTLKKPTQPDLKTQKDCLDVEYSIYDKLIIDKNNIEKKIDNEYKTLIENVDNQIKIIKDKWNEKTKQHNELIDSKNQEAENKKQSVILYIKSIIDNNNNEINDKKNPKEIINIDIKIAEIKDSINQYFNTIIPKLKDYKDNQLIKLSDFDNQLEQKQSELNNIEEQINSGVCPTCNRAFDNLEERINHLKHSKEKLNNDITELKSQKESHELSYNKTKEKLEQWEKFSMYLVNDIYDNTWYEFLMEAQKNQVLTIIELISQKENIQKQNIDSIKDIEDKNIVLNKCIEALYNNCYINFDRTIIGIDFIRYWEEETNDLIKRYNNIDETKKEFSENQEKINLALESLDVKRDKLLSKYWERHIDEKADEGYYEKHGIKNLMTYYFELQEINNKIDNKLSEINKLKAEIEKINLEYQTLLNDYTENLEDNNKQNKEIQEFNKGVEEHNNLIIKYTDEYNKLTSEIENLEKEKLPKYNHLKESSNNLSEKLLQLRVNLKKIDEQKHICELNISRKNQQLNDLNQKYDDYLKYQRNKLIFDTYKKLIEGSFKNIVFEYYRTYMNNTLNVLLEDMDFKLIWTTEGELYMCDLRNGGYSYRPVIVTSGMETSFLGLALIYTMHVLNIKNTISLMLIDELSGQLNKGEKLTYKAQNFQELFVKLLNKFQNKSLIVVDHNIENLYETVLYEVIPNKEGSKYIKNL